MTKEQFIKLLNEL